MHFSQRSDLSSQQTEARSRGRGAGDARPLHDAGTSEAARCFDNEPNTPSRPRTNPRAAMCRLNLRPAGFRTAPRRISVCADASEARQTNTPTTNTTRERIAIADSRQSWWAHDRGQPQAAACTPITERWRSVARRTQRILYGPPSRARVRRSVRDGRRTRVVHASIGPIGKDDSWVVTEVVAECKTEASGFRSDFLSTQAMAVC